MVRVQYADSKASYTGGKANIAAVCPHVKCEDASLLEVTMTGFDPEPCDCNNLDCVWWNAKWKEGDPNGTYYVPFLSYDAGDGTCRWELEVDLEIVYDLYPTYPPACGGTPAENTLISPMVIAVTRGRYSGQRALAYWIYAGLAKYVFDTGVVAWHESDCVNITEENTSCSCGQHPVIFSGGTVTVKSNY